ncbi:hypothetical protein Tco_0081344 [Tanacetum coccineum]
MHFNMNIQHHQKNQVPQKVDETNDLSKPVTSNSVPTPQESKIVKHDNVIAPGMFREEKFVPNKVRASVRTTPITVSQPHAVTKKDVNSDSNGLSSTGEHVEMGTIELYFVKTDYQLADLFTKALPVDRFNYLVRRLGMRSLSPKELERLAKSQ